MIVFRAAHNADITKNIVPTEVPHNVRAQPPTNPQTKEPYKVPNRKERRKMAAARRRFKRRPR